MKLARVVLDTNVVISALLFKGEASRVHALWKKGAFKIAASREIVDEYLRVLAYPKFKLTENEIKGLIQKELLPFVEPVTIVEKVNGVCVGPDDDKFLACAIAAKAGVIVSGDAHLLSIKSFKGCAIVTTEKFLKKFR